MRRSLLMLSTLGWIAVVTAFALCFVACDHSAGDPMANGSAEVRVLLTDAPSDLIQSAEVSISRVILIRADGDGDMSGDSGDGGFRYDLLAAGDAPQTWDLMELRDGVQALIGAADVPAGRYSRLRLVVDSATVTLAEGLTFNDGSSVSELHVPSGMQSGIKVDLDEAIDADDGSITIVVVDFDVDENFVIQGNPETPAGIQGITFTPVLKEIGRHVD